MNAADRAMPTPSPSTAEPSPTAPVDVDTPARAAALNDPCWDDLNLLATLGVALNRPSIELLPQAALDGDTVPALAGAGTDELNNNREII